MMLASYLYNRTKQSSTSVRSHLNPIVEALFNSDLGRSLLSFLLGLALSTVFFASCDGVDCVSFKGPIIDDVNGTVFVYNDRECTKNRLIPVDCDATKRILPFAEHSPTASTSSLHKNTTLPTRIVPTAEKET